MQEIIKDLVDKKKLLQITAKKILGLNENEQSQVLNFIHKFQLGLNYSKEFVDYIIDVIRRDKLALVSLLQQKELAALADHPNLPHARKMELLRHMLREKRFPYFYQKQPEGNQLDISSQMNKKTNDDFGFNKIYVSEGAENEDITHRALVYFRDTQVEQITNARSLIKAYSDIGQGKKILVLSRQKGKWLESCPGTKNHICCNYLVINNGINCPFDCTYCYLQSYINNNLLVVYVNISELLDCLDEFLKDRPQQYYRIGTGEFSDSLALDDIFGISELLVHYFSHKNNCLLELKTKSDVVDHILGLEHNGRVVVGWSVNPEQIIASEEIGAVSLAKRLDAARKCVTAGYKAAFHFDPMFFYNNWEKDYAQVVDQIFGSISEKNIAWISLGALRYHPSLKDVIEKRFPHSRITLGELDIADDNKMRYFKPIRQEMFYKLNHYIRKYSKRVFLYLCMESHDVWQASQIKNDPGNDYARYFKFFSK